MGARSAYAIYDHWIASGVMEAAIARSTAPANHGYSIEWKIGFEALHTTPGAPFDPNTRVVKDTMFGLNIAIGDVDTAAVGDARFGACCVCKWVGGWVCMCMLYVVCCPWCVHVCVLRVMSVVYVVCMCACVRAGVWVYVYVLSVLHTCDRSLCCACVSIVFRPVCADTCVGVGVNVCCVCNRADVCFELVCKETCVRTLAYVITYLTTVLSQSALLQLIPTAARYFDQSMFSKCLN